MALSNDDRMGQDSVIECVAQSGIVNAFTSFTTSSSVANPASPRLEVRFSKVTQFFKCFNCIFFRTKILSNYWAILLPMDISTVE